LPDHGDQLPRQILPPRAVPQTWWVKSTYPISPTALSEMN